jgi:hypothetical protein
MVYLLPLKMSYFNSPEHNLACPLKKKSIETCKSYIFEMKVLNSQNVTNVWNIQPFLHLRAAGCLNTAYLFVFTINTFIGDWRHTLWLNPLKMPHFNSPKPNLACPLKKKSIENYKSLISWWKCWTHKQSPMFKICNRFYIYMQQTA